LSHKNLLLRHPAVCCSGRLTQAPLPLLPLLLPPPLLPPLPPLLPLPPLPPARRPP